MLNCVQCASPKQDRISAHCCDSFNDFMYSLILCKGFSNKSAIRSETTESVDSEFCKAFATDFISGELTESMRHAQ